MMNNIPKNILQCIVFSSTNMASFIQACDQKIYGDKIWINLNSISSFSKDAKFDITEGQWYKVVLVDGRICYTTYNLPALSIFTLPTF